MFTRGIYNAAIELLLGSVLFLYYLFYFFYIGETAALSPHQQKPMAFYLSHLQGVVMAIINNIKKVLRPNQRTDTGLYQRADMGYIRGLIQAYIRGLIRTISED
jgi:hypothetical protein